MIYKCKNCGCEYKNNIEYCDCGNNKFICIPEKNVSDKSSYNSFDNYYFDENDNTQTDFKYSENSLSFLETKGFQNFLIILIIIFTIGLSAFTLFKAINLKSTVKNNKTQVVQTSIEIPDIDEYWDNSNPENISNSQRKTVQKPMVNQKNNNLTITPLNANTANKNTNGVNKNFVIKNKLNNLSSQQKQREEKTDLSSPKVVSNSDFDKNIDNSVFEHKNKNATIDNTIRAIETDKFKVQVRQSLFSKFPVLSIQGQGSAIIAFSVAKNGKLLNRRFLKQSGNKSLDDAIYHMLMKTPFVLSPPESYSDEELLLKIDFDNGEYSFSYK